MKSAQYDGTRTAIAYRTVSREAAHSKLCRVPNKSPEVSHSDCHSDYFRFTYLPLKVYLAAA
eukprot:scaffold535638_cov19-Prasinocladus_malaysianus.AAC.1